MKEKVFDRVSKVFGIAFMIVSLLFPIIALVAFSPNGSRSFLFFMLVASIFAVTSMFMTYNLAVAEKIRLYKVIYVADIVILIFIVIGVLLGSLVVPL